MISKLPDINKNFTEWYQEVVYKAELADQSPVRGCIVIRPYGWSIWENIRNILDQKIKDTGHQNASFPLLIPKSFIKREAEHIEGFAPELAVVTHAGGKELEESLVIRPTSETIIHFMFSKWIKSYRDLPLKINQWANVVRWEMRTRPFLRTTEFHWQEGHTVHETYSEAEAEAYLMLNEYKDLIENYLAIPVIAGEKPESERFAGADKTLTMEGLMPDGKALQMGTSHMLSQNFAKSFDIKFQDRKGQLSYPYLTSWGVTTRLIGALVMIHGDSQGLILPPLIAPIQIVIIPILKGKDIELHNKIIDKSKEIVSILCSIGIRSIIDLDEKMTPGNKFYHWEMKGVPLRLEIGPRDLENNEVISVNRINKEKIVHNIDELINILPNKLLEIQQLLFNRAKDKQKKMLFKYAKLSEFKEQLEKQGGLYQTGWCNREECEEKIKESKATIRCVLQEHNFSECFNCNRPSSNDILIAKAY